MDGINSDPKNGDRGPAFVGQVFSMCDPSGTGLVAVTEHLKVPFLSERTSEWINRMVAAVTKCESTGPVFRFFMDLGDAVSYVKRLNFPTGMVGSCRLSVAYQNFKDKPHMFQFVPNASQVRAANKLLRATGWRNGKRKIHGVPVFSAENLNIAIATKNGIRWYAPYFFDKKLLDNILETSVDQHFNKLIRIRHVQRRQGVIDDSFGADTAEENADSFEPPEVQEVLDEMGHPGIPLTVISKVAEIQMLDVVDRALLGNRFLRKATGIQPKFPYMVDSFEARSTASSLKAKESTSSLAGTDTDCRLFETQRRASGNTGADHPQNTRDLRPRHWGFQIPFRDWIPNPWLKPPGSKEVDNPAPDSARENVNDVASNPLLPQITMVGISTAAFGNASEAILKKTMMDLTKELEKTGEIPSQKEDIYPLFVANVGDYSTLTGMNPVQLGI